MWVRGFRVLGFSEFSVVGQSFLWFSVVGFMIIGFWVSGL